LPSNRVKNAILERLIVLPENTVEKMNDKGLSSDHVIAVLNDGDVLFNDSDKDGDSKAYVIEKEGKKYIFTLPYESFISEVFIGGDATKVENTTKGMAEVIHYPADENLVYPDSSSIVTCQQEALGLISAKEIFKKIKETGKIDFSKSDLSIRPKPEHYVIFQHNKEEIGATVIWYKNKLNIISFHYASDKNCE